MDSNTSKQPRAKHIPPQEETQDLQDSQEGSHTPLADRHQSSVELEPIVPAGTGHSAETSREERTEPTDPTPPGSPLDTPRRSPLPRVAGARAPSRHMVAEEVRVTSSELQK